MNHSTLEKLSPPPEGDFLSASSVVVPVTNPDPQWLRQIALFLRLIFTVLVLAFCYFASSLCITIVLAAFLAILFDPVVVFLGKLGAGRVLASGAVVFCLMTVMGSLAYAFYNEASQFAEELPAYSTQIRRTLGPIIAKFDRIQKNAESITPAGDAPKKLTEVRVHPEGSTWPAYLLRGFDSITGALIMIGVLPFLLFFMLAGRDQMTVRFMNIFQAKIDAPKFIANVGAMIRGFMLGNLIVGSIMAVGTSAVFLILGVKGAVILGIISGFLNLIPFLGLLLATAVPEAAALLQFHTVGPFAWIALTTIIFHLIAANVLIPKWIGSRLLVGPVAVTIGMLFWGWLWGAIGILLALPLTAFVKLVADAHPSLLHLSGFLAEEPRPIPRWVSLGENTWQRVGRRLVKSKPPV